MSDHCKRCGHSLWLTQWCPFKGEYITCKMFTAASGLCSICAWREAQQESKQRPTALQTESNEDVGEIMIYRTDGTASCTCGWSCAEDESHDHQCIPYLKKENKALREQVKELEAELIRTKAAKTLPANIQKDTCQSPRIRHE